MYGALLERSSQSIDAVKRYIAASDGLRDLISQKQLACKNTPPCFDGTIFQQAPDARDWKVIDHCSAVTRLYAIYEQFSEQLLREYLAFLETNVSYPQLDSHIRDEHRRLLGQILIGMDKDRYKSLLFETVLTDSANAFRKGKKYRLLPEAMLLHEQNLRAPELARLCARCGINGVLEWLKRHRAIKNFFSEPRESDTAEAELRQLVDYRNDAAHGGIEVDDVLGPAILVEYANFLLSLFQALVECVQWHVVKTALSQNQTRLAGKINEIYSRNIVVAIVENSKFEVGQTVFLRGDAYCYKAKILSLQENGTDVQNKTVLNPTELGIKFDTEPKMAGEIYFVKDNEDEVEKNARPAEEISPNPSDGPAAETPTPAAS